MCGVRRQETPKLNVGCKGHTVAAFLHRRDRSGGKPEFVNSYDLYRSNAKMMNFFLKKKMNVGCALRLLSLPRGDLAGEDSTLGGSLESFLGYSGRTEEMGLLETTTDLDAATISNHGCGRRKEGS